MSEFTIVEAAPVPRRGRQGAGRKKAPNPLHEAVRSVIGQTDPQTGGPLTRGAKFTLDTERGETLKQATDRIRRLLTRAGKELAIEDGASEPYLIRKDVIRDTDRPDDENAYVVVFHQA